MTARMQRLFSKTAGSALLVLLLGLYACDGNRFFEENKPIDGETWTVADRQAFTVDIQDTTSIFNFYFNFRHTGNYRYANIFVFLDTEFPNGELYRDTLECLVADQAGKWHGSGLGDLKENSFLFKRNVGFDEAGTYTFTFENGMRDDPLEHVKDVGMRIEKVQ